MKKNILLAVFISAFCTAYSTKKTFFYYYNGFIVAHRYLHIQNNRVNDRLDMEGYSGNISNLEEKGDSIILITFMPEYFYRKMRFYKNKETLIWQSYVDLDNRAYGGDIYELNRSYFQLIESTDLCKVKYPIKWVGGYWDDDGGWYDYE